MSARSPGGGLAAVAAVATLLGCAAPPRPPTPIPPLPPALTSPWQACRALQDRRMYDLSARELAEVRQARAALRRLLRARVAVAVVEPEAMLARLKRRPDGAHPLLRGEIIPLSLRVQIEGEGEEQLGWFIAELTAIHDGTIYGRAIEGPGDRSGSPPPHDVVRALFAERPPPLPPEAARTTAVGDGDEGPGRFDRRAAREELSYLAACHGRAERRSCEALVPLGRAAPSLAPEELRLRLFLSFAAAPGRAECGVSDERAAPLPPGATLRERLRALFAGGALTL